MSFNIDKCLEEMRKVLFGNMAEVIVMTPVSHAEHLERFDNFLKELPMFQTHGFFWAEGAPCLKDCASRWHFYLRKTLLTEQERLDTEPRVSFSAIDEMLKKLRKLNYDYEPPCTGEQSSMVAWRLWLQATYAFGDDITPEYLDELYRLRLKVGTIMPADAFMHEARKYLSSKTYFMEKINHVNQNS